MRAAKEQLLRRFEMSEGKMATVKVVSRVIGPGKAVCRDLGHELPDIRILQIYFPGLVAGRRRMRQYQCDDHQEKTWEKGANSVHEVFVSVQMNHR